MSGTKIRIWPAIGAIAVAAIWTISAIANWWAGTLLATDPTMSHILGGASVACDVIKAVALFIVMGALMNKRWFAAGVAMILFGLCTAWSLRSAAYFAADAITEKVAVVETNNALAMAKLQIIDAKTRRAQFLAEQRVTVTGPRSVRQDALQANKQSAAEFGDLTSDLEDDIKKIEDSKQVIKASTDPLADLLQVDRQVTILATAMFFALLMELASSTGFWLIARASARPAPAAALQPAPEQVAPPPAQALLGIEREVDPEPTPALPAASNIVRLDFVDQDTRRLREAIRDTIEPGTPDERVLIATLAQEVSRRLPKAKAVTSRAAIVGQLTPALAYVMPEVEKKRAAGQTWVYGVRLRQVPESANG